MNLPDRRDTRAETPEPRPGIRPRPIQQRKAAADKPEGPGELHFSCPACLRMMSAGREAGVVSCPSCQARVMPPQFVGKGDGKELLPPPTKTGRLK